MSYAYEEDEEESFELEFELLNSEDMKTVTLVCFSNAELSPAEYADALRAYADRIESILSMVEIEAGTLN